MCTMLEDFSAMLLGSLLWSYNSYLSAVTATLSVLGTKLTPDALMLSIIDEFDHRTIKTCQSWTRARMLRFMLKAGPRNCVAYVAATYSDSAVESVTISCFLEDQETASPSIRNAYPMITCLCSCIAPSASVNLSELFTFIP